MIKPHQNHGNPWVSVLFLPLLCGWFGLRQLAKNNIPRAKPQGIAPTSNQLL
jgi:hypothetical protein